MTDRDDVKKPLDHLPPAEERDEVTDVQEPQYPAPGETGDPSRVTPETAAEPEEPRRHGLDKLPPSGA